MKIHILGICGTFMGGIAILARALGHEVSGSDAAVYPPMSDTLREAGIEIIDGFSANQIDSSIDCVIVGNAISRGNPALEAVLNQSIPYTSGAQWLSDHVLQKRHVLAVSGTHGKTTVTSLLVWILQKNGLEPGYLVGGLAKNFPTTAALGRSPYFVVEADEYDTAFFDKRSKFLHYRPSTLIINNLEFDHADIFKNLEEIQKQFSILLRTVPSNGLVIRPSESVPIDKVLAQGCWASIARFGTQAGDWKILSIDEHSQLNATGFSFTDGQQTYQAEVPLIGQHNVENALAAIIAADSVGVEVSKAVAALESFAGVKRRMEVRGQVDGVTVYDDFAHHPTAIERTLRGLRTKVGKNRIVAVLQFASNTMRDGHHEVGTLVKALETADQVVLLKPEKSAWDIHELADKLNQVTVQNSVDEIIRYLTTVLKNDDHVIVMSNRGFEGIHQRLLSALTERNS